MTQMELEERGFVVVQSAIDEVSLARLLEMIAFEALNEVVRTRLGDAFGARALLRKRPLLADELRMAGVDALASALLDRPVEAIDALFFDKRAAANWTVPGHQDRMFPVSSPTQHSRARDGVFYAEPDLASLAELVALRIHFDATDASNGALCFVPGSHRSIVTAAAIRQTPLAAYLPCEANAGDVIAMRPLVLHRSSPSKTAGQRRVLHVVYRAITS